MTDLDRFSSKTYGELINLLQQDDEKKQTAGLRQFSDLLIEWPFDSFDSFPVEKTISAIDKSLKNSTSPQLICQFLQFLSLFCSMSDYALHLTATTSTVEHLASISEKIFACGGSDTLLSLACDICDSSKAAIEKKLTLSMLVKHLPKATLPTKRKTLNMFKVITNSHYHPSYISILPILLPLTFEEDERISLNVRSAISNILTRITDNDFTPEITLLLIDSIALANGLESQFIKQIQASLKNPMILDLVVNKDLSSFLNIIDTTSEKAVVDSVISVFLMLIPPAKSLPVDYRCPSVSSTPKAAIPLIKSISNLFERNHKKWPSLVVLLASY